MSLYGDFLDHGGRAAHKWKHYFPVYERHFAHLANRTSTILEVGCGEGGSLQLWKRYLGPHARVVGLDIDPRCAAYEEDQVSVRIGDQKDPEFLARVVREFGAPDVVVDDGSHRMADVLATFDYLYPHLSRSGVYLVEDMHCAYWEEYGGGLGRAGTFVERAKHLVDELNADHSRGALPPTEFTRSTLSVHFYDSVVVFERGAHTEKLALVKPA